jgi:hypothetical protein
MHTSCLGKTNQSTPSGEHTPALCRGPFVRAKDASFCLKLNDLLRKIDAHRCITMLVFACAGIYHLGSHLADAARLEQRDERADFRIAGGP